MTWKEYIAKFDEDGWYAPQKSQELVRCKDCKHRMHNKTCIRAMKKKADDGYCDEAERKEE